MARGHRDIFAADIDWLPSDDAGLEYAPFALDADDPHAPLTVLSRLAPGATFAPHTHASNYLEYVIHGSQTVGKVAFHAGDVRLVAGGTGYGPITVGADGCTVLVVFQDASGTMIELLPRKKAAASVPA